MTDDGTEKAKALATIANSKAAEKLTGALDGTVGLAHKIVELIAGPNRIAAVEAAKSRSALLRAQTDADIEILLAKTRNHILADEIVRTVNRESIVSEAYKSLPPPDAAVSENPVSDDFIPFVMDRFDGISDPEVHKIVGRLIAGEVVKPGSFSRRTISILSDMESADFVNFTALCRFSWFIAGHQIPLIFDLTDQYYRSAGVDFTTVTELESLGLIRYQSVGNFTMTMTGPGDAVFVYDNKLMFGEVPQNKTILTGVAGFTAAGLQVLPLTKANAFPDYQTRVIEKYKTLGVVVRENGQPR